MKKKRQNENYKLRHEDCHSLPKIIENYSSVKKNLIITKNFSVLTQVDKLVGECRRPPDEFQVRSLGFEPLKPT